MMMQDIKIGANDRVFNNIYLFQVKTPAESKAPWDDLTLLQTIPGDEAHIPVKDSVCPLGQSSNARRDGAYALRPA